MRAHEVDLSLGNGAHTNLVEGSREEGGKGAAEHDVPVTTSQPNPHAADVLLGNEALHIAAWEGGLVGEREGRVLGVPVQSNNAIVALAKLDQRFSINLTSSMLKGETRC